MKIELTGRNKGESKYYICFLLYFFICLFAYSQTDSSLHNSDSLRQSVDSVHVDSSVSMKTIHPMTMPTEQHVYKVNYWISGSFALAATVANIWAISHIIHGKNDMTDQEVLALNKNNVNSFDRWAFNFSPSGREAAYKFTDIGLTTVIAASGVSLAFDKEIRKDLFRIAVMFYEMHAITFGIYDFSPLGPNGQNRVRPYSYYTEYSLAERKAGNQKNSRYSGHVASAVASTFFAVKVYSDYHPEMGGKKFLYYGLASIPPLFLGYMRIRALAHFPTDVLEGFAIGAVCGIVVPQLHKIKHHDVQLSLYSNEFNQQGLTLRWSPAKHVKMLNDFRSPAPGM